MKIKYFSESAYHDLFDTVGKNLESYTNEKTSEWLSKKFGNSKYWLESRIDIALPEINAADGDYINAILIHSAFKGKITPKQASNPYLWSYLSHCVYWKYTQERWNSTRTSSDSIKTRFFCGTVKGNRIGFLRNSISRLWWIGELTYQENSPNPYELTELLLSNSDIQQSILERKFSMNKEVTIGILKAMKEINDNTNMPSIGRDNNGKYEWRNLCEYINRYGAVTLLDALDRDDIYTLSMQFLLNARSSK